MGLFHQFTLGDETLKLESGDILIAFTDGLTDAVNHRDEDYGHTRLTDAVDSAPAAAEHVLAHILKDLENFTGRVPQPDDITLVILTRD